MGSMTRAVTQGLFALAAVTPLGCGAGSEQDENVLTSRSALTTELANWTPSVFTGLFPAAGTRANTLAMAVGSGDSAYALFRYYRVANEYWAISDEGLYTYVKPFWWLENGLPSLIYYNQYGGNILDTRGGGEVFGGAPTNATAPVALQRSDGAFCAYFLATNARIQESCIDSGQWLGWQLINQVDNATTSPIAINRSSTTDSLWYGCATGTSACEIRINGFNGVLQFKTNFGTGSFMDGTRPTAVVTPDGTRFVFAVTVNGTTKSLLAKRETSAIGSTSPPTYQSYTLVSSTSAVTYSSLMPFVRTDGTLAVIYYSTTGTGTTKIMQQVWSGSAWGAATQLWDVGQQVPVNGGEPVAYISEDGPPFDPSGIRKDTVFYRRPEAGGGVRDTIQLEKQASGRYLKTQLPHFIPTTDIYVEKGDNKLYKIDDNGGAFAQLGTTTWTSTTSLTSDRIGLGYAISNSNLYEITLGDGSRRQLGSKAWTGGTELVFGFQQPATDNPHVPGLWAVQGGALWKIDLTNGSAAQLGSATWTSVTSMGFLDADGTNSAKDLYIVNSGNLYRVDSSTGASSVLGTAGAWTGETSMATSTPYVFASGSLYIFRSNLIKQVNPTTGVAISQTGTTWSGTTGMTELQNKLFVTKGSTLYSVNPSGWASTAVGGANWPSPVFITARL